MTRTPLSFFRRPHLSSSQSLLRNITLVAWLSVAIFALIDYFSGFFLTAYIFAFLVVVFFPFTWWLIVSRREELVKALLLFVLNVCVLIGDLTVPFEDGSSFFFVPIGLLSLIFYDLDQRVRICSGLGLPLLCYLLTKIPGLHIETAVTEQAVDPELTRTINFIGIYVITMTGIMVFIRHIQALNVEASLHSKFSALGVLSSSIAHEINNPLTIIKGKADVLTYRLNSGESRAAVLQGDVATILRTAARIAKIVNGLRMFTRDSSADPFLPVPASLIVETALDLCHDKIKQCGIRVETRLNHALVVDGRETQLTQVLVNLLNNSCDAIEGQDDAWILIEIEADRIAVTDSGAGIPPQIVDQIMVPFFTTKGLGKGTGLGLAISQSILEQHGGQLSVDQKHKNTRFIMKFR